MKRSEINRLVIRASGCFQSHGWTLPPIPRWDVTDFGLGDYKRYGLVLVNLAEESEYCEKVMYALKQMTTPAHSHHKKKEDIICRWGELAILVWEDSTVKSAQTVSLKINGMTTQQKSGEVIRLSSGERVTLTPGLYHEFYPLSEECIIGEVSTANDDLNDNIFVNPEIGRYATIDEDEAALVRLISDR